MKLHDWDDLRFFLAVARSGSLSGAARHLGVNHSTVSRRLAAFEEQLDVRLFERSAGGYEPTTMGRQLLDSAQRMEEELATLDRRLLGQDTRLSGSLRIATADLGAPFLTRSLVAFAQAHPGIELEVVADDAFANLTRREADVAFRASNAPPEHLVGRRLANVAMAVYASPAYLEGRDHDPEDLSAHDWIGWDESRRDVSSTRWLRSHHPSAQTRFRVNSPAFMLEAAKAGQGAAFLACFRGDTEPGLRRIHPPVPELDVGLWILTHEDLRATARVRSFMDFIAEQVAPDRDLLEGRRPAPW
jgi:DNA-binding transcriptional LysR family regulator